MTRTRTERGAASVELAVIAPALLLLVALMAFGGRVATADIAVGRVAATAARDASLQRTPTAARAAATTTARSLLGAQGLHCSTATVVVDTTGFTVPAGPGTVSVRLRCVVSVADLGFTALPGSRTVAAAATSPVDPFRSTP